jgi:hypothetical protein
MDRDTKFSDSIVDLLLTWQHAGFSIFRGEPAEPRDPAPRERLVSYLLHPAFGMERLHYDAAAGTITYNPATQARRSARPTGLPCSLLRPGLACRHHHPYPRQGTTVTEVL